MHLKAIGQCRWVWAGEPRGELDSTLVLLREAQSSVAVSSDIFLREARNTFKLYQVSQFFKVGNWPTEKQTNIQTNKRPKQKIHGPHLAHSSSLVTSGKTSLHWLLNPHRGLSLEAQKMSWYLVFQAHFMSHYFCFVSPSSSLNPID